MTQPLEPARLRSRCDPAAFDFETTDQLDDVEALPGQERASEAVRFGVGIARGGFNLFVMGPPGAGRRTLVSGILKGEARSRKIPNDWCYVNNFAQPHRPSALELPPGRATEFARDMKHLIDELKSALPGVFEADEYRARVDEIDNEFSERESSAFRELGAEAEKQGVMLLRTPVGFGLAPTKDGEVVSPEEFEKLPEDERKRIHARIEVLHERLQKLIRQGPQWAREKRERIRELNREFSELAVAHLIDELREKYAELPEVLSFLDAVRADLIEHTDDFRKAQEPQQNVLGLTLEHTPSFQRYQVNVLVDNGDVKRAPLVAPDHPSMPNLVGRIEHMEHLGALVTDFTLIKPGALHEANGGYLLLDARRLLTQPYAYEALKRALFSNHIRTESLGQMLSLVSTLSLEPEPIPLDLKVILFGERLLYYLLFEYDPDFRELFKVVADFEDEVPRDRDSHLLYARLIATLARKEELLPLDRAAVARVIEQAARLADDSERLATHVQSLQDLLHEADHLSRGDGLGVIGPAAVEAAIAARRRRSERLNRKIQEAILRDTLRIATSGTRVGQVNGLSVIELGGQRFGHPTRITSNVRLGEGELVDIQREVELGGPIHSKGVLILSSFLATRYASTLPLSLSASLVFEQTYSQIEGDSASMAELCALLSALAGLPIRQDLAITGSVDQFGQMQAIGGVNEKIEGFFEICAQRGLGGGQGVLIPEANVKHLMLRDDVVDACREGRFAIYPVADVDQAIELLTGVAAGEPDAEGVVPEGSVNYLVAARLHELSRLRQEFAAAAKGGGESRENSAQETR